MSVVTVSDGVARYSCQEGYTLTGESTLECRGGLWRGTVPHCDGRVIVMVIVVLSYIHY